MRYLIECVNASGDRTGDTIDTLTLDFDKRQRSRLRAVLDSGEEIGVMLPRGTVLRSGDLVRADDGALVRIRAAAENVSTARTADPRELARACYHLGNRHVPLQIADGWVRYCHDHVLDDMVRGLGLAVEVENAPFEPEPGAYGHSHSHSHSHSHAGGGHD